MNAEAMRSILLVAFCLVALSVWTIPLLNGSQSAQLFGSTETYLQVHFLDVGQGDAIFIESPDGAQALIDGGPDGTVIRRLAEVMPFYDRSIDVVVATHPDKDHIGGLNDVLQRFSVSHILKTESVNDTHVSKRFEENVQNSDAEVTYARIGQRIKLGETVVLEVLFPELDSSEMESNASSIVLKVLYGDISFLLTGDAPKKVEEYLVLTSGEWLQSDVLKVGHHGSRTSTSELFLDEVLPTYAVVSAGRDNQYGHPHLEVTDLLFNTGVTTFNTAEEGTISFYSDGETVWVE